MKVHTQKPEKTLLSEEMVAKNQTIEKFNSMQALIKPQRALLLPTKRGVELEDSIKIVL